MTRERALELADNLVNDYHEDARAAIVDTILAVVAEEREACAKIAEGSGDCGNSHCEVCNRDRAVSAEIRERK